MHITELKIRCYPPESTTTTNQGNSPESSTQTSQRTTTDDDRSTKTKTVTTPIRDNHVTNSNTHSTIMTEKELTKGKNN